MNWRRLAWLVILLLVVTIVWAVTELKGTYAQIASVDSKDPDHASRQLTLLQERIAGQREKLAGIENLTLWPKDSDPIMWLTQQADDTGVRIIGVEHLPVEQASIYQNIPVTITISGDYNPLGRFINKLEHSSNLLRINSLRIRRRKYTLEHTVMDLSLSYFQKMGEPS